MTEQERLSIYWFCPQLSATAKTGPAKTNSQEFSPVSDVGVREPTTGTVTFAASHSALQREGRIESGAAAQPQAHHCANRSLERSLPSSGVTPDPWASASNSAQHACPEKLCLRQTTATLKDVSCVSP